METMVCTYVFAWAAVVAYLAWLAVQNARLCRRLDELERRAIAKLAEKRTWSKAA